VLQLEARRGYDNGAVAGGTDRLLLGWLGPAASLARSWRTRCRLEALRARFAAYADLPRPERAEAVAAARAELAFLCRPPGGAVRLAGPVSQLPGLGPRRALLLSALGVHTVEDLLLYFPTRYLEVGAPRPVAELGAGESARIAVRVSGEARLFQGKRASRVEVQAEDCSGRITLVFFNQPYRATQLRPPRAITALGQVQERRGRRFFVVRRLLSLRPAAPGSGEEAPAVLGQYRAPQGIPGKVLREAVAAALGACGPSLGLVAPAEAVKAAGLLPRPAALRAVHQPRSLPEAELGRRSLVFEQLLVLQTRLLQHRAQARSGAAVVVPTRNLPARMQSLLAFRLTAAQERVLGEVAADLGQTRPAYRLIHGEVGSGKTVVAAGALLAAAEAGLQAALMAPTEILAEQHAARLEQLLRPTGVRIYLLTGSLPGKAKAAAQAAARAGEAGIWVGTHALLQAGVDFWRLAVAVVDEQHRFGVAQRAALIAKGCAPHFFALSATPIPRTLALALYADFDISLLDELPPGRKKVATVLLPPSRRAEAYALLQERLAQGQQAFIVCPLIEPSAAVEAAAAEEYCAQLRAGPLRGWRVGLVHGRLPTPERQQIMHAFYAGELEALVSTTVIEVGVDVPRAAVILVENAERFGLAQLHQLRGRVARSPHEPVCVLVSGVGGGASYARLQALVEHGDGFKIAELDLRLRGAGELVGLRQHGLDAWVAADVLSYPQLLAAAQREARKILDADPQLAAREHQALAEAVAALGALESGRWAL
jgi:ATP-dependent DNA helicase RecG